jgi:hypothetical protein
MAARPKRGLGRACTLHAGLGTLQHSSKVRRRTHAPDQTSVSMMKTPFTLTSFIFESLSSFPRTKAFEAEALADALHAQFVGALLDVYRLSIGRSPFFFIVFFSFLML